MFAARTIILIFLFILQSKITSLESLIAEKKDKIEELTSDTQKKVYEQILKQLSEKDTSLLTIIVSPFYSNP